LGPPNPYYVQVKKGKEAAFVEQTIKNCRASATEGGIHRFDLLQNAEDSCNFVLLEVYSSDEAPAAHKATAHYLAWR
jgi:(4S)-4-hydroxy-5-phosphonooxypentane-2,3-dione isomerase